MTPDKKCVFFAGGKLISIDPSNAGSTTEGIKLTRNADKSWTITVNATIPALEADKVILQFSELKTEIGKPVDESNPNMPFIKAFDDTGNSVFAKLAPNSSFSPAFFRDLAGGIITLRLIVADFGKTQNVKTQNVAAGH